MNNYQIFELQEAIKAQKVSHILHLIFSVLTAGLWLPVWFVVWLSSSIEIKRLKGKMKTVCDHSGN